MRSERRRKMKDLGVWCVYGVLVSLTWMLFTIPTITFFVHVSMDGSSEEMSTDTCDQLTVNGACDHQMYSGVCTEHLLRYQMCHSNGSTANRSQEEGVVYIPSGRASHEGFARNAILNLTLLDPSPSCKMELAGFICLSLFGVCTDGGEVVRPSSGQCERLRTEVCVSEWETAEHYEQGSGGGLFDNISLSGLCDVSLMMANQTTHVNTTNQSEECSPNFYLSEDGQCVPQCGEWKQYPKTASAVLDPLAILGGCVYIVGGMAVLVLSCTKYKNMYKFPGILLIYQLITLGLPQVLLLISYTNQKELFCSHQSFTEARTDPTVFCHIIGGVTLFTVQQVSSLFLCHTLIIVWGMMFPFHARRTLDNPRKKRCIHITTVLVSIVPALIKVAGSFVFGGYITNFPPIGCQMGDRNALYFLVLLPASIKAAATASCLILVIWLLAKRKHKHVKAVKRILILLVHFMVISLALSITYSAALYEQGEHHDKLSDYFQCESTAQSCSTSEFEHFNNSVYLFAVSWFFVAIYPLVLLVFMPGDARELGKVCQRLPQKLKRLHTAKHTLTIPSPLQDGYHIGVQVKSQSRDEVGTEERDQQGDVEGSNHVRMDEQGNQDQEQDQSCRDDGIQMESGL